MRCPPAPVKDITSAQNTLKVTNIAVIVLDWHLCTEYGFSCYLRKCYLLKQALLSPETRPLQAIRRNPWYTEHHRLRSAQRIQTEGVKHKAVRGEVSLVVPSTIRSLDPTILCLRGAVQRLRRGCTCRTC